MDTSEIIQAVIDGVLEADLRPTEESSRIFTRWPARSEVLSIAYISLESAMPQHLHDHAAALNKIAGRILHATVLVDRDPSKKRLNN